MIPPESIMRRTFGVDGGKNIDLSDRSRYTKMNLKTRLPFSTFVWLFVIIFSIFGTVSFAADVEVADGEMYTIKSDQTLTTEKYGNSGTVNILSGVLFDLGSGVTNLVPLSEGAEGLDLGMIINSGTIDAQQTLRFKQGSMLSGTVNSTSKVIFDGPVKIDGNISGSSIVFNIGTSTTASTVDLTKLGGVLDTESLIINGNVQVTTDAGTNFQIKSLELGQTGATLTLSEGMTVTGNFRMATDTTLASKIVDGVGTGKIVLMGDAPIDNGTNNVLAGTVRAESLTVYNKTYINNTFNVQGDFILGKDSETRSTNGLVLAGKLQLEQGAVLKMDGDFDGTNMIYFGTNPYNGIFNEGFDLATGSLMTAMTTNGALNLALLDASTIAAGARITTTDMFLSGIDASGEIVQRKIVNRGSIEAAGTTYLSGIQLQNVSSGTLSVNKLILLSGSELDLSSNDSGYGLVFSGDDAQLYISNGSVLKANRADTPLEFVNVTVDNRNTAGGIQATRLLFGSGAILQGGGQADADTVFANGSTLKVGLYHTDFKDKSVTFETGSTIVMSIDVVDSKTTYGAVLSKGVIRLEDGVNLEIADGSNFDGRTDYFCVAQGGEGSTYGKNINLDSLFFKMSDVIVNENSIWAEIVKVANMVDFAGGGNQAAFAQLIDDMLAGELASEDQKKVIDSVMRIGSDKEYRNTLRGMVGSLRSNSYLVALAEHWRVPFDRIGMERLSLNVNKRKHVADASTDPVYNGQISQLRQSNLWFSTYYNHLSLSEDNNALGGNGDRGGFHLGNEWTPSTETLLGVMFGYGGTGYKQDDGKLSLNDYHFGLYGGANLYGRNLQLRGYLGYGLQDYKFDRTVAIRDARYFTNGDTSGNSFTASLQLIRPMDLSDNFLLKPTLGIDFEQVRQDGFSEHGDPGVLLAYQSGDFSRTMLRIGATGERSFDRGVIWGRLFYGVKLAGDNAAVSDTQFIGAGSDVPIYSVDIGESVFDVGFGGRMGLNSSKTVLLLLDYNGGFTKKSDTHTGTLGVIWKR